MVLTLDDGAYDWTVRSRDWLGNASVYAAEWTVNVDTTPPSIPTLFSPVDDTFTNTTTIEFSWQDVSANRYNLRVDGAVYTTTATSMTRVLVEGVHNWAVQSKDWLGNASGYADEWTVTVDTTPPSIPDLVSPADNSYTNSSDVLFSWSDVGAPTYQLRVDGVVYVTRDTSMTRTLDDGAHNWTVQALDWLDNASGFADEWTVNVDTTPPGVPTLQSPEDDSWTNQSSVEFHWSNVSAKDLGPSSGLASAAAAPISPTH